MEQGKISYIREKIKNAQSIIEETNERVQNFITENKLYY